MDMTETATGAPSRALVLSDLVTYPGVERALPKNTNRTCVNTNPTYMGDVDPLAPFAAPLENAGVAAAELHTEVSAERFRSASQNEHPRAS